MYSFSHRLAWTTDINPFAKLVAEKRALGVPLLDLTISNPTEVFENYPHQAIQHACSGVSDFTYNPNPLGEEQARQAIADWYAQRGITISAERIALTASSSEAYAVLFKLLCDPGDEVLVPIPSYPLFEFLAALESVRVVPYRLLYDGAWFIDFADLEERISSRTRAIIVVNPNNPTGSFLKETEKERFFALTSRRELPIISDEVFMDYESEGTGDRVKTLIGCDSVLSFSLNGLSKSAGMPQMKLGWIVINGPTPSVKGVRERLELIFDTYLSVATPVQRFLRDLLQIGAGIQQEISKRIRVNLSIVDLLQGSPAHRLHLEGGWSAIIQLPKTLSEEAWLTHLIERCGIIVHPGHFFDMATEPYVVVSLITAPKVFEEGISRLAAAAKGIC